MAPMGIRARHRHHRGQARVEHPHLSGAGRRQRCAGDGVTTAPKTSASEDRSEGRARTGGPTPAGQGTSGSQEMSTDKLEITELLYRYAELIDAGDFDGVGRLLARSTFGGPASGSVSGAESIAKLFAMTTRRFPEHGNTPRTRHLVLNPIVELGEEGNGQRTASARSTFCVVQNTESVPLQPIVLGRYFDAFARDGAGWYFTERKVDVEMVGDVSTHLNVDPRQY